VNDLTKIRDQLRSVLDDMQLLDVPQDNKTARHLVNRLSIATDNVAGCVLLAKHDLASPLLIVARAIVESLFVTYWATLHKKNAEIVLRLDEYDEIMRVGKYQLQEGIAEAGNKTTGQKISNAEFGKLEKKLNIFEIAKECKLKRIYDIAYKILCVPAHGNVRVIMANPPRAMRATLEIVRCTLMAMHLIVGNYVREGRTTCHDDILRLMFPPPRA
jgi:hypothetical protein